MRWTNEVSLKLIAEYRNNPVLWNNQHSQYFNKRMKSNAWYSICRNMNMDYYEIRNKVKSLRASYRRERTREIMSLSTGKCVYHSEWFAYKSMEFLYDNDINESNTSDNVNVSENSKPDHPMEISSDSEIIHAVPVSSQSMKIIEVPGSIEENMEPPKLFVPRKPAAPNQMSMGDLSRQYGRYGMYPKLMSPSILRPVQRSASSRVHDDRSKQPSQERPHSGTNTNSSTTDDWKVLSQAVSFSCNLK